MSGSRIIKKLLNMIGKLSKYKTIVMSLAVIVAGVALAHFKLISDIIIMYIPVPAVSWFVFHGSKKEREDNAE